MSGSSGGYGGGSVGNGGWDWAVESAGLALLDGVHPDLPQGTPDVLGLEFWLRVEQVRELLWGWPTAERRQRGADDSLGAWAVRATSPDGHEREAAVRRLAKQPSAIALPVLALRAADWVPQVRAAARAALLGRLDELGVLATVAPMAARLADRAHGAWLLDEVTARLAAPDAATVVRGMLSGAQVRLRRLAYRVLAEAGRLTLDEAVLGALRDRSIVVRVECARYAARLADDTNQPVSPASAMHRMLRARTPMVRAEALTALAHLGDRAALHPALDDPSALVRGTARFHLRPDGVDFAALHRASLAARVAPGAVAGLAETGSAEDVPLFTALLADPAPRVRVQAIRALQAHGAPDPAALLDLVVHDPSAAVKRQALTTLLPQASALDPDHVLALLAPERNERRVRNAARRLLTARDHPWRLAVDVLLLTDPELAEEASSDLGSALARPDLVQPTGRPAELLAAHLATADRLLPRDTALLLRFTIGLRRAEA